MKLTERLYAAVEEIWASYLEHPFVRGLADGTLAQEKFRFYMVQDYCYLLEYAKVFALGVVKARDEKTMTLFANLVQSTLTEEMSLHRAYLSQIGVTERDLAQAKMSLANRSYTAYMLDVSQRGDAADILAAVLACAWSYLVIGAHHAKVPGAVEHPVFGPWVASYASEEYRQSVEVLLDMIDAMGETMTEQKKEEMTEIFYNCSRYEYDFWEMAEKMEL